MEQDDAVVRGRDVFDQVEHGKRIEQFAQGRDLQPAFRGKVLLVNRDGVREYARVTAHQLLEQVLQTRIVELVIVEQLAVDDYLYARGNVHVFAVTEVVGHLKVLESVEYLALLVRVVPGNGVNVELELEPGTLFVSYPAEYVNFLIYVLNVRGVRE